MILPKYDVLELKYPDGSPAVLRHVDGSGFAYYQSGRKAICLSAHGRDPQGKVRRFGAIVHGDAPRSPILGSFDEWGRGSAEGLLTQGDVSPPKIMISEGSVTIIDGAGRAREVPLGGSPSNKMGNTTPPQIALRLNAEILLQYSKGRTTLDFNSGGVNHKFTLGEMKGEDVLGMTAPSPKSLAEQTMQEIGQATQALSDVKSKISDFRVDPTQPKRKRADGTSSFKVGEIQDMLESLNALSQSLLNPNLAPPDLKWNTEGKLKQLIAASHPPCPGLQDKSNWNIGKVSGKCTTEKLLNAKPTVATPKTVQPISQLRLPELVDELASQGTLLVVICLATYAMEQSKYAKLLAEKVHADLHQRYRDSNPAAVQFVAVELTEISSFAAQYSIKEAPYCLMFQGGSLVYSKRLRGMRLMAKEGVQQLPHVLLVCSQPAQQLKLERSLRRSGCAWDLAMDTHQALRLASRATPYTAALVCAEFRTEELRSIALAVRRVDPASLVLVFDAGLHPVAADEEEARMRFFKEECSEVLVYSPSYTALHALLNRKKGPSSATEPSSRVGAERAELLSEVLGVLERGQHGLNTGPLLGTATA